MMKSWPSIWLKQKNDRNTEIFWIFRFTLQWPYCWQGRNILQHPRFLLRSGSSQTWKSKILVSSPTREVSSPSTKVSQPLIKLSSPIKYHHQSSPLFIEDKSWIPLTGHASSPCELYKSLLLTLENQYFIGGDGDDHRLDYHLFSSFWPILVFVKRSYC